MEALNVEYNLQNNTWSFIYYAKPHEEPGGVRTYDADTGIESLTSLFNGYVGNFKLSQTHSTPATSIPWFLTAKLLHPGG